MNVNEAKTILLLYRPGTEDALALAKVNPELTHWLEAHCYRQMVVKKKFRQIPIPTGLKEQIISEQAALEKSIIGRSKHFGLATVTAVLLLLGMLEYFWPPQRSQDDTLIIYRNQMISIALRGYGMDLTTNNPVTIHRHLAQCQAPADFELPPALQQVALAGCAIENWQDKKVSMICFRTAKLLPPGEQSDLWLFVAERSTVAVANVSSTPQLKKVNRLITATWTQGDKIYLLGTEGDEHTIRQYL